MATQKDLVQTVTRRLLLCLLTLFAFSALFLIVCAIWKTAVSVLAVSMVFGICGGFISVQRRLKAFSAEDLELLASSWPYVFLSPVTGGFLAVILYMLFVSGLLAGELFPSFEAGTTSAKDFSRLLECTAKNYTDYAKLIFWSFVSGFCESFVTDIIGSFVVSADRGKPE